MEYSRAYRDETPDWYMIVRHEREIFPLMKKRHIFSGSLDFCLYDLLGPDGKVNDNVFAYSNRDGDERALVLYNNSYFQSTGWIRQGAVAIPQKDGTTRQDSLCEALGLHGEDRYFTVFREQRSGLWFIRSSKEIAERGLFATLNGYEAQVFLDIQEKEDAEEARHYSWENRWSLLNHELNGRGVSNLEEAAMDMLLGELYAPFREILSLDRMEALTGLLSPKDESTPSLDEYIESYREPVNAFMAAAKKYLDGGDGKYQPWRVTEESLMQSEPAKEIPEIVWKEWSSHFESILTLSGENPELAIMALGYQTLTLLRSIDAKPEALAVHWQLDRILRECWENAGVSAEKAQRAAKIALALLARPIQAEDPYPASMKTETKTPGDIAAAIILENYDADDFRKILGVNRFDDVTWFNKEAFEENLVLVPLFLSIGVSRERVETIAAVAEVFRQAEEASGYRLDELHAVLAKAGSAAAAGPRA